MCNTWHQTRNAYPRKVKPEGVAYKLVEMRGSDCWDIKLRCMFRPNSEGWVNWALGDNTLQGFCAFRTLKEAKDALRCWAISPHNPKTTIVKIHYRNPLGTCGSRELDGHYRRFLIVRSFKFAD